MKQAYILLVWYNVIENDWRWIFNVTNTNYIYDSDGVIFTILKTMDDLANVFLNDVRF